MPDSRDHQSNSGQPVSNLPIQSDLPLPADRSSAETGDQLLNHLGRTIIDTSGPETNIFTIPKFKTDDVLAGKYQIVRFISRGSTGMVYQARHIMLDKMFAIKILSPNEITSETSSERFQREAHAASSLSHPNIITVNDFGILPENTLYLAMEFLEGETLSNLLEREGRLDFKEAIVIFMQVCLALEYAHTQGIIHRDLKPSNIMLIKDYKNDILVKVIDFSIAKFTKPKANQRTITKPGEIFGTPLYMSPEQCQGKKPDHRSDIYSLGCVLYETLTGAPPLLGDSMLTTIYRQVNDLPAPFSQKLSDSTIPPELEAIVFKTLAKQPEDRYQSAEELRTALESFLQGRKSKGLLFKPLIKFSYQLACMKNALWVLLLFVLACFAIAFCLFLDSNLTH